MGKKGGKTKGKAVVMT